LRCTRRWPSRAGTLIKCTGGRHRKHMALQIMDAQMRVGASCYWESVEITPHGMSSDVSPMRPCAQMPAHRFGTVVGIAPWAPLALAPPSFGL